MTRCLCFIALAIALIACRESRPPSYTRIEGRAPAIEGAPGSAQLVVFWAAWCPPCREETPSLRALAKSPPQDLAVLVLSQDPDMESVASFLGGAPEPELDLRLDRDKKLFDAFGVGALPAAFLLIDGHFAARFDGLRDWNSSAMRALLERLIEEKNPPSASKRRN